jgi:dihydrofolate reductase
MTLTLIACVDKQNVLSCDGGLAYKLPEDLQHFKDYTMGKTVFAGKNTYKECYKLKGRDWVELYRKDFAEVLAYAAQAPEELSLIHI